MTRYEDLDNYEKAAVSIVNIKADSSYGDCEFYSYNVDANGIPAPTYSLIASPNNMTIDANTGLIEWTPDANQLGSNAVTVRATNSEGFDEQNFNITVLPSDNFNDNKRGAMWRLFAEDYDNVRVVEDANRLEMRATGNLKLSSFTMGIT